MHCHSTVLMCERITLSQKVVTNLMKRKACFHRKGVCGGPVMANKMFILHCTQPVDWSLLYPYTRSPMIHIL